MTHEIRSKPIARLHGIEFLLDLGSNVVRCHLLPEALEHLRDVFLAGLRGSPLELFEHLRNKILRLAHWKLSEGLTEANGLICLRLSDAVTFFMP